MTEKELLELTKTWEYAQMVFTSSDNQDEINLAIEAINLCEKLFKEANCENRKFEIHND